ncbi:MAG: error-prone polymerase, partial [Acidimicrobiaceae bacterium]
MRGEKGAPRLTVEQLGAAAAPSGGPGNHWYVLTGCRKGTVPAALARDGPRAARRCLDVLVAAFGRDRVLVELWDHGDPLDRHRNDALAEVALAAGVEVVATNNVHYATTAQRPLATALAAVRSRRSLDEIDGWLPASPHAQLRTPAEQTRRFARWPGAVERTVEIAGACAFDLRLAAPNLPDAPVPEGHTEMTWLRELVRKGAAVAYPPTHAHHEQAQRQLEYELGVIDQLGFPGYFLLLFDIVDFCRQSDIYCQGRGSSANSAVCYALGVTKADAVTLGLLFERFLSPERDGPPDIDLDIEHQRREEVIQYVYDRYGRDRCAQVANVVTYRPRSALREMAKATGVAPGQADALAKWVDRWSAGADAFSELVEASAEVNPLDHELAEGIHRTDHRSPARRHREFQRSQREGVPIDALPASASTRPPAIPPLALELAGQLLDFPRHLGIHSGGMVMADRPLVEFCPVEWARMEGRSVLQWDKDDCAAAGLVKFDLLGLGMLSALHYVIDLVREHHGVEVDLATIPQEDEVYEMLSQADSIGVFQVESRAQMATLPRLKPREFYDLVVEVALIRPGPIQGGSVHPYICRRNGLEEPTYLHPLLKPSLAKTLGVPLFQEQLMQMAIDVAGFSAGEADQLRQAMGSKRSRERMERLKARFYEGMAANGITGEVADAIYDKLAAFANFGFPESHSVSFAYLVYASSWFKLHYPAAFCAALLNAQPMGFWAPDTLVRDARRHGVHVRRADINDSDWWSTLEADGSLRLGIKEVRSVGEDLAKRIAAGRPYVDMEDVVRRAEVPLPAVEALATAGAFRSLGHDRRSALWAAGATSQSRADRLPGVVTGVHAPQLPGMSEAEETSADLWATGIAPDHHPVEHVRAHLDSLGVITAEGLRTAEVDRRVLVGGVVTHRQRPATASGMVFVNLEDETGLINVICSAGLWARHRRVARTAPALLVRGTLERVDGVINVIADRLDPLPVVVARRSRDFR